MLEDDDAKVLLSQGLINTFLDTTTSFIGSHVFFDANGNYAYVISTSSSDGFEIVDVSDPVNMSEVGSVTGFADGGVKVIGNYAYVTDFPNAQLKAIDVTDKANPVEVNSITAGEMPVHVQKDTSRNLIFVGEFREPNDIFVFDVSTPDSPVLRSTITIPGRPPHSGAIQTDDEFLYLFSGGFEYRAPLFGHGAAVFVYDIDTDITNPTRVLEWKLEGRPKIAEPVLDNKNGDYFYVPHQNDQFDDSIDKDYFISLKNPVRYRLSDKKAQLTLPN